MILHLCLYDQMFTTVHKVLAVTSQNIAFPIRCYVYVHPPHVYIAFCSILHLMRKYVENCLKYYLMVVAGAQLSQSIVTCMQRPSWRSNRFWWQSQTAFPVVTTFTNLNATSHNLWAWISKDQHGVLFKDGLVLLQFRICTFGLQVLIFSSSEYRVCIFRVWIFWVQSLNYLSTEG